MTVTSTNRRFCNGDRRDARRKSPTSECLLFVFLCFLFSPFSSSSLWSSMYSNVGVWRLPSPPPVYEMCGLNRFATNYTYFTSAQIIFGCWFFTFLLFYWYENVGSGIKGLSAHLHHRHWLLQIKVCMCGVCLLDTFQKYADECTVERIG